MRHALLAALVCSFSLACGGAKAPPPAAASSMTPDAGDMSSIASPSSGGATSSSTGDAGAAAVVAAADVDAGAPDPHPFAKDAAAAESMIDDAIESRHAGVEKCASEARKRMGDPHGKVSLLVGIDQEGSVIGVKVPKGEKKDEKLLTCVRVALKGAPFPKSHNGIITIKKTYEEALEGQL
jgi:hypothetical protein